MKKNRDDEFCQCQAIHRRWQERERERDGGKAYLIRGSGKVVV